MIQGYPNIEYDAKTRRINRWMKFLAAPIVALMVLVVIGAIVEAIEGLSNESLVVNDTGGDVACYAQYTNAQDETYVKATGRLAAGQRGDIAVNSRCAVFNASGDYVGCFVVRESDDNDSQIMASSNNPRVKAAACVYPR
jgi:hypothetical protein